MHHHILTFIILPNVGYWKGVEIVSKKLLLHTKKILTVKTSKNPYNYRSYYFNPAAFFYLLDGEIHSQNDLPAIECVNGDKLWYKKGVLHRKGDLPAVIEKNGDKYWIKNGLARRKGDLPHVEHGNGLKSWYKKGFLVRQKY